MLEGLPDDVLRVRSDQVHEWIQAGDPRWEQYVLPEVAAAIREKGLFGCTSC